MIGKKIKEVTKLILKAMIFARYGWILFIQLFFAYDLQRLDAFVIECALFPLVEWILSLMQVSRAHTEKCGKDGEEGPSYTIKNKA